MSSGSDCVSGLPACDIEPFRLDFERAILPHLDAAFNLAYWLTRDRPAAEDIVQEAVLRGLRYFGSCRQGHERGWLLRIVRNTYFSAWKVEQTQILLPLCRNDGGEIVVSDPSPDPEKLLEYRECLTSLAATLAHLPAHFRECLILREIEELSYKEIAQILEVPVGTVMSRLSRARQALMERWPADAVPELTYCTKPTVTAPGTAE